VSNNVLNAVWKMTEPRGPHRLALVTLADLATDAGFAWPSYATLAKMCSISRRRAMELVDQLVDDGLVILAYGGGGTKSTGNERGQANVYLLRLGRDDAALRPLLETVRELAPFHGWGWRFQADRLDPRHSLLRRDETVRTPAPFGDTNGAKSRTQTVRDRGTNGAKSRTQTVRELAPSPSEEQQQQNPSEEPHNPERRIEDKSCLVSAAAAGAEAETAGTPTTIAPPEAVAELARLTAEIDALQVKASDNGNFDRVVALTRARNALIRRHPDLEAALPHSAAATGEQRAEQPTPATVAEPADSDRFAITHAMLDAGLDQAFAEEIESRFALNRAHGLLLVRRGVSEMQTSQTHVRRPGAWFRRFLQREVAS
jgi:hypothetical protein